MAVKTLTPSGVLNGASPLILTATLKPVADQDRFQPAGFPEVGHVIYKAPRQDGATEQVCIVDSAASMANHLESVCMRGAHDLDLVEDLAGMPYLRCVTGDLGSEGRLPKERRQLVVTSLTEGHRIASDYFLEGNPVSSDGHVSDQSFTTQLIEQFGIKLPGSKRAHPPPEKWWDVFETIFRYDPNALVHGVLFPQWQIKIARVLSAHLEAFGATRVDRSGVKFDRIGKTNSGQPIFAVDDTAAREIRATFVLDAALLRSFGRKIDNDQRGLSDVEKEFLVALALWKIKRLVEAPFRYRSGCHLEPVSLKQHGADLDVELEEPDMPALIKGAFSDVGDPVTDIYWPEVGLYRDPDENTQQAADHDATPAAPEVVDDQD